MAVCANAVTPESRRNASLMQSSLPNRRRLCLGKMRQEVTGQVMAGEQGSGRLAGKFAEIADEVRLVVVASDGCGGCVSGARFDRREDGLKAAHAGEELRRKSG